MVDSDTLSFPENILIRIKNYNKIGKYGPYIDFYKILDNTIDFNQVMYMGSKSISALFRNNFSPDLESILKEISKYPGI